MSPREGAVLQEIVQRDVKRRDIRALRDEGDDESVRVVERGKTW